MKKLEMNQMEKLQGGKMACGVAVALYGAAFVGAALATGGAAIALGLIGIGGAIATVDDAC